MIHPSFSQAFRDFHTAIRRDFDFLFAPEAGFCFVGEGENLKGGEYQFQVARAADCQIKFFLEQDVFRLYLGQLSAPYQLWEDVGDVRHWHDFWSLRRFEDHLHPEQQEHLPPDGQQLHQTDAAIQSMARLLQAYLPRLRSVFSSRPPAGWWTAYEASQR